MAVEPTVEIPNAQEQLLKKHREPGPPTQPEPVQSIDEKEIEEAKHEVEDADAFQATDN